MLAESPHSSLAPALTPLLSVEDVSELEPSGRAGPWLLPGLLQILFRASFICEAFFSSLIFLLLQRVFPLQVA